jgi:hypothetical protein
MIDERMRAMTEAIGEIIAEERKAYRAALARLLDEERAELRRRFGDRLEPLDRPLGTFARTELTAWPLLGAGSPNWGSERATVRPVQRRDRFRGTSGRGGARHRVLAVSRRRRGLKYYRLSMW